MSLINDALKKAQRQRSDNPVASSAEPLAPSSPKSPTVSPSATGPTPQAPSASEAPKSSLPINSQAATPSPIPPPVSRPTTPSFKFPSTQTAPPAWKTSAAPSLKSSSTGSNSPLPRSSSKPSFKFQTASSKEPVSPMTLWLWLGGIAIALVSVGVTLSIINSSVDPAPPAHKTVTPQTAQSLPAPSPLPQPITPPAPTTAPANVTAVASNLPAQPVPAVPETEKPIATATPPQVAVQPTAAPATAAALPPLYAPRAPAPVNPSTRIQNFINRLRVTGIRVGDTETKVILGDRLFKIGEIVDPGLELRLTKAEEGVLTFTDATGKTYIKVF